jgi:membrane-bound metal-dependent hydrolase YbcI (DUF457 family)
MITYSHVLINLALRRKLPQLNIPRWPVIIGGFVPDLPLTLLSLGTFVYYRYGLGIVDISPMMRDAFDTKYFTDPFWIAGHNMFHSPTLVLIMLALLWRFRAAGSGVGYWLFWFYMGCLSHSLIDVLTHYNDGPVLFFPFDFYTRFYSPVSYWDPDHYGREFAIFEHILDLLLLVYLLGPAIVRRFRRDPAL